VQTAPTAHLDLLEAFGAIPCGHEQERSDQFKERRKNLDVIVVQSDGKIGVRSAGVRLAVFVAILLRFDTVTRRAPHAFVELRAVTRPIQVGLFQIKERIGVALALVVTVGRFLNQLVDALFKFLLKSRFVTQPAIVESHQHTE
jgi:hypothetical protein